jgi:hypothetical protein
MNRSGDHSSAGTSESGPARRQGKTMSSRERVLTTLNHQEPDRVPLDMGATIMSGIMAHALDRLRKHLGLSRRPVKVYEVFQILGEVEMDVVDRLGIDVLPVEPSPLEEVRKENLITGEELEFLAARAEMVRRETDKALLLGCWGWVGLPWTGSIPDFLCLMAMDRAYVLDLFAPELFEKLFLPYFKQQNDWVHRNTSWKIWQHTCGSVTRVIPLLVESGLGILNPVQTSAAGMDPAWLKREFGSKIIFWGGGVDTQKTLPFARPEEVGREVAERVRIFAPGGGFVFNTIHNIQQATPPENILAAYDTARTFGRYPIRE